MSIIVKRAGKNPRIKTQKEINRDVKRRAYKGGSLKKKSTTKKK
jgi:hypothetical protein